MDSDILKAALRIADRLCYDLLKALTPEERVRVFKAAFGHCCAVCGTEKTERLRTMYE
jgi:hypothetical protein